MYDLPYYKAHDQADVIAFMKAHSFITLCGVDANASPVATHIPVLVDEHVDAPITLRGHIQRKSDHHKAFIHHQNVLAIFNGAHSFVSASWYTEQNIASTWNYQAVHAAGVIRFIDNEALYQLLTRLTEKYEHDPASPAQVKHLGDEYMHRLMKAIIGFEITITSTRHIFKLSQNRNEASRQNIIEQLSGAPDADARGMAEAMKDYYKAAATSKVSNT